MVYLYIKHNFADSNIFSAVFQIALKCSCEISLHILTMQINVMLNLYNKVICLYCRVMLYIIFNR